MFENYPIQVDLNIRGEEQFQEILVRLKEVYESGGTPGLFETIIGNLHNAFGRNRNELPINESIESWCDLFSGLFRPITIAPIQLELILHYLIDFHPGIIQRHGDSYMMMERELTYNHRFIFEHIALNVLDI